MVPQSQGSRHSGFEVGFLLYVLWLIGVHNCTQIGGFSHGKSYATDVAEILARSQMMHRGPSLPPSDTEHQPSSPSHRAYPLSPQSFQQNERPFHHVQPAPFAQQRISSRVAGQRQPSGGDVDVDEDTAADQKPTKKAWQIEVERLRLSLQSQQISGMFLMLLLQRIVSQSCPHRPTPHACVCLRQRPHTISSSRIKQHFIKTTTGIG
jgi:hypothetical protein